MITRFIVEIIDQRIEIIAESCGRIRVLDDNLEIFLYNLRKVQERPFFSPGDYFLHYDPRMKESDNLTINDRWHINGESLICFIE